MFGVAGSGCIGLQAPAWVDPSTQDTPFVDITIDIEHGAF